MYTVAKEKLSRVFFFLVKPAFFFHSAASSNYPMYLFSQRFYLVVNFQLVKLLCNWLLATSQHLIMIEEHYSNTLPEQRAGQAGLGP